MRFALISIVAVMTTPLAAAYAVDVKESADVKGDATAVWAKVGPWCAIQEWHPAIASCAENQEGNTARRVLTLKNNGGVIKETRTARGDGSYSYRIDESPLPVQDYSAEFSVKPASSKGMSTVSWTAKFKAKGTSDTEAAKVIDGIFSSGLESIKTKMGS